VTDKLKHNEALAKKSTPHRTPHLKALAEALGGDEPLHTTTTRCATGTIQKGISLGFQFKGGIYRIRKWAPCSTSGPSDYRAEGSNRFNMAKSKLRQLVRFPWAADSCPWVGKLRTVLPLNDRVIRDSAVPLGLTHQRGAN
jgi:hypothetical protein